jgi:hypothetical protein
MDDEYCPYCGAHEYHTFGWSNERQRWECIVQKEEDDDEAKKRKK